MTHLEDKNALEALKMTPWAEGLITSCPGLPVHCGLADDSFGWDWARQGLRVAMLVSRRKDSAPNKTHALRLYRNEDEFEEIMIEFAKIRVGLDYPARTYITVNKRDQRKGIRKFKMKMVEADYLNDDHAFEFFSNLQKRYTSCLMNIESRASSYFMVDIDIETEDERNQSLVDALEELYPLTKVRWVTETPSGWHVIVDPFNRNLTGLEIKGDPMTLYDIG